jgi:hypothetical protein
MGRKEEISFFKVGDQFRREIAANLGRQFSASSDKDFTVT